MKFTTAIDQDAKEDVFFGQVVTIGARWFLIVAGMIMLMWTAVEERQAGILLLGVAPLIALTGLNFFLHGSYLLGRPLNSNFILLTSLLDIAVITLLVLLWPGQRGLDNQFFIFYYPAVLAFAFSMPRKIEVAFTVVAIVAYSAAVLPYFDYSGFIEVQHDFKSLLIRLIALGAVGGLGNYYFRIYRSRRKGAMPAGSLPR